MAPLEQAQGDILSKHGENSGRVGTGNIRGTLLQSGAEESTGNRTQPLEKRCVRPAAIQGVLPLWFLLREELKPYPRARMHEEAG